MDPFLLTCDGNMQDMWQDFLYWKDMLFQEIRFCARFHYGDINTILNSSIRVVRDDRDKILATEDWFRDFPGA